MQLNTSLFLAQAIEPNTSFLGWMVSSLATMSSFLIIVTAALLLIGACYLVAKKRSAASLASYLVLLPLPLLISICGWIYGSIASLATIAASPNLAITNQGIAGGLAASLLSVLFAILVSFPTYVVLAYGLIARDFRSPGQGNGMGNQSAISPTPRSTIATAIPNVLTQP